MTAPDTSPTGRAPSAPTALPGHVVTFYSYKGGVGRSMALANVAALLSQAGKRVLVVDWDLEAPGLERYFAPWLRSTRAASAGIVDLMAAFGAGSPIDWRKGLLEAAPFGQPPVHILTAGRADERYPERLQGLRWERLFEERNLGEYLEQLRSEWTSEYDLVLVDSRTGITDIGGICSVLLPDWLVAMFTANEQSLQGVIRVAEIARSMHARLPRERSRLVVIPIPSRDESRTEREKAEAWHRTFAERLAGELDWLPRDVSPLEAVKQLKLPHVPFWNFGEELPVKRETLSERDTLSAAYGALSRLLASGLDWSEVVQGATIAGAAYARAEEANARASAAQQEAVSARKSARRSRRWVAFAAIGLALAAAGTVMAYRAQKRAEQVTQLLAQADQLAEKSPDAALALYDRAIALDPSSAVARYRRGLALLAANDATKAESDFTAALAAAEASGERPEAARDLYAARGRARERKDDLPGALADYRKVVELDPKSASTWARIGGVHQALAEHGTDRADNLRQAVIAYGRSIDRDPRASDVLFSRGTVLELQGDKEGARKDFLLVADSPSSDPDVAEAARSRLRALGGEVGSPPKGKYASRAPTSVYVQYAAREDATAVGGVLEQLGKKERRFEFSAPELVAERGSDVRFFFRQDEKAALDVKTLVEGEFARQGTPIRLSVRFVDASQYPQARPGRLEVWLPPLRLSLIQQSAK